MLLEGRYTNFLDFLVDEYKRPMPGHCRLELYISASSAIHVLFTH